MKRVLVVLLVLLLTVFLVACGNGNNEETSANEPSGNRQDDQVSDGLTQEGKKSEIICDNYNAFKDAQKIYDDYVLEQSHSHEVVSVMLGYVTVNNLRILNYLLPLEFYGQSLKTLNKIDLSFETNMLRVAWADDAELIYNEGSGYLLKGTDTNGNILEVKTKYDKNTDSLHVEGYKDGTLDLVFEYCKTAGGYAAQYYFETIIGYDKATAIEGWCTYRTIFGGYNGSCARFDNVTSEPVAIFANAPDAESFIAGATHWFTIKDGQFLGKLKEKEF